MCHRFFNGYISANSWCLEICFFQLTYERSSFFIWSNPCCCCLNHHNHHSSGWWLTYPSEKWWSPSLGVTIPNWQVIKAMFQTTNQICSWYTIWLWHSQFAMENPPIFQFGKPSISMGHVPTSHSFHGFSPTFHPHDSIRRATKASWSRPSAAASAKALGGTCSGSENEPLSPVKVGIFGIYNPQKWGSMMI